MPVYITDLMLCFFFLCGSWSVMFGLVLRWSSFRSNEWSVWRAVQLLVHGSHYPVSSERDREVWNRYGRIETGLWFTWPRSCINPLPTAVWIEGSSASWSLTNLAEMSSLFICSLPPCLDLELIFPIWNCRQASWSILVCSLELTFVTIDLFHHFCLLI